MAEKTLMERTKRLRVKGTGPHRSELVMFKKLGDIPMECINELNQFLDQFKGRDDIGTDNYKISQSLDYQKVFANGGHYRQVLMQDRNDKEGIEVDEYLYDKWVEDFKVKAELAKYFKRVFRFRMSEMIGEHSLNWHIDSCTSVMCRAQICLNENDAVFEFKDKKQTHSFQMKPGELWFINTGWPHRVVTGKRMRRVAILGYHFDDLRNNDLLRV